MRKKLFAVFLIISLLGVPGCIKRPEENQPMPVETPFQVTEGTHEFEIRPIKELEGTIKLSGDWALYPVAVRWGEEFHKLHPNVTVNVTAGGTDKGMTDTISGQVDIGMVSRDISGTEQGAYPVAVTQDAVVPVTSAKNPALKDILSKGIKRETLAGIFTGRTSWGKVLGNPEITQEVHVYTRSDPAGDAEVWAEYLDKRPEDLRGTRIYGEPGMLSAVQKDPLSIGYNSYSYVFDAKTGLPVKDVAVIPLDVNENGAVDTEEDISTREKITAAIENGTFPRPPARMEYFVTRGKPTGLKAEFIRWVLTDGQKFAGEAGYVELDQETLNSELEKID